MWNSPLLYFTDAVLRAPTIASMLMCCAASLVGVIVFLRKESLLGEALSHAAYPGVLCGVLLLSLIGLTDPSETQLLSCILTGAFFTALLGLWLIALLETRLRVPGDAALCFILSAFFGIGLTLASHLQFTHTGLYRQAQAYLFGQVATMTDAHIAIYGALACATILFITLLYKEIQLLIFDERLASTLGIPVRAIRNALFCLIVFAVVIGLRSVGVVLMSAMFIAPAVTARQFTNHFSMMLVLAALFGTLSGFLGNYLSVEISKAVIATAHVTRFALPTGPMVVLVAAAFCILSLLFAFERGLIPRFLRAMAFRARCLAENLLKSVWRFGPGSEVTLAELSRYQHVTAFTLWMTMQWLAFSGWVERTSQGRYRLNHDGQLRAAKIVRLHRLWEVYLVDYLGVGGERVHRNAEEMEHILTPDIERELTRLLNDPKRDPHRQPIPAKEDL
jgi:manganese/zinc/iron transport system permease protein